MALLIMPSIAFASLDALAHCSVTSSLSVLFTPMYLSSCYHEVITHEVVILPIIVTIVHMHLSALIRLGQGFFI